MDIAAQLVEDYVRVQIILLPLYCALFIIPTRKANINLQWGIHALLLSTSFLLPVFFYLWRYLHPVRIVIFPGTLISGEADAILHNVTTHKFYFMFSTLTVLGLLFFLLSVFKQINLEFRIKKASTYIKSFRSITLYFSPSVKAPFVTGLFNKAIYFPERIRKQKETFGLILSHELYHIRKHHIFFSMVERVHQCIGWFNPFSHFLAMKGGEIREMLCDLNTAGKRDPAVYSRILVAEAEMFSFTGKYALAEMFTKKGSFLKRRVAMLMSNPSLKHGKKLTVSIVAAFLAVAGIWGLLGCGNYTDEEAKVNSPAAAGKAADKAVMDEVRKVVMANISQIKQAFDAELQQFPDLMGKIVVEFTIKQDGSVENARRLSSDMNMENSTLEKAVVKTVGSWSFTPKDEDTRVVYPFLFHK